MMRKYQIGIVSFLNSRSLGHGLQEHEIVQVRSAPPSQLADQLDKGLLDVALVPVVDYLARVDRWELSVPYGICSQGEVWTVKIFSPVPIDKVRRLVVDSDSHTSINLAKVVISRITGRIPELVTRNFSGSAPVCVLEPTLLIGDKAWQCKSADYVYDLGQLWQELFDLPFVYALWVSRDNGVSEEIEDLLTEVAERNLEQPEELGQIYGPRHGFTPQEAAEYFKRIIRYRVGPEELSGLVQFRDCLTSLKRVALCRG
jgi:chorismate dehydratase